MNEVINISNCCAVIFDEYNKLKNINNNIITYDVSVNEISGNIIISNNKCHL